MRHPVSSQNFSRKKRKKRIIDFLSLLFPGKVVPSGVHSPRLPDALLGAKMGRWWNEIGEIHKGRNN